MKIGFCFLVYDIINHEDAWEHFFRGVDPKKYGIYIHYKFNKPLKYFERHKLETCIDTKYVDVSLIHAYNMLFKRAYDDGCYKMAILSNSCVPLKPFDHVFDFLTKDNFGHFNVCPQEQCFPRCEELLKYYPRNVIQKSLAWFVLNRELCESIFRDQKSKIDNEYSSIYAPEEHYYITHIFANNLVGEIKTTPNTADTSTTFVNWEGMDYPYPSDRGIKTYLFLSNKEMNHLLKSPCLFGRKFSPDCHAMKREDYIRGITNNHTV
jgi:hypothetical protein